MRMRKLTYLAGAVFAAGLLMTAATGRADTFKISTTVPETSNWMVAAEKFKEIVEAKTSHKVEIYPNGVLVSGNDRVELEMAQAGAIDIIMKTTIWLSQLNQDFLVTAMPWMFPNAEVAMKVMDGPTGQQLSNSLTKVGLQALAWGDGGFFQLYSKEGPIKTPDDISGVKIRVPGNPIFVNTWKEIGAVPTPISFAEIFSSLQSGAIDGGVATTPLIYAKRFYEAAPYTSIINFSFEAVGMIASKSILDRLSAADQAVLKEAAIEGMKAQRATALEENKTYLSKMTEAGSNIYVPTAEELGQFKAIAKPVYEDFKKKVGVDLVTRVEDEVKALSQ